MSNSAKERVMEEDRNLIIRAVRLMMSGGRRYSFMERTDRLDEYEAALLEGNGEEILDDLADYKKNHQLLPVQLREADDLYIAFERRIEEIKAKLQSEEKDVDEWELINGKAR